ncbi:hypothetical protein FKW77_008692 [Venturia effusa]|uniref:Uncharacterized protein n=1 Tax=Venturia effusa TaxID=50376 RepID=A0A517L607_9PEZI|nr:hypothetical protein FKW77_008692 [Venturia effusa]
MADAHRANRLKTLWLPHQTRRRTQDPMESSQVILPPEVPFHSRRKSRIRPGEHQLMPAKLVQMNTTKDRPRNTTIARNGNAFASSPSFMSDEETAAGEPLVHDFATCSIPREYKPFTAKDSDTNSLDLPMQRPPAVAIADYDDDDGPESNVIYSHRSEAQYLPLRPSSALISAPQRRSTSAPHYSRELGAPRPALQAPSQRTPEPQKESHVDHYTGSSAPSTPRSQDLQSPDAMGYETGGSSTDHLPALQVKEGVIDNDALEPVLEDDPASFDLVPQAPGGSSSFHLEDRSDAMFSRAHLEEIFKDRTLLLQFTSFLSINRPQSIPVLVYYLDALKALRAIAYANAISGALEEIDGHDFAQEKAEATINSTLKKKADQAFETLVRDELPAYITHTFISVVSLSIQRRITGTLAPHLRESSEGLAEVFCLTDPSRPDNPIVFASEEFHRTTQYGVSYAIGRNCRFLQGPRTNRNSVKRFATAIKEGKEVSEVFLNYRRDGSPFMNMLMVAPLLDSRGNCRYFIGAQVDVSGLCKDCTDLQGLQRLLEKEDRKAHPENYDYEEEQEPHKDEFQAFAEILSGSELETIRRHGGKMHSQHVEGPADIQRHDRDRPRLLLKDQTPRPEGTNQSAFNSIKANGKLEGIYQNVGKIIFARIYSSFVCAGLFTDFLQAPLQAPGTVNLDGLKSLFANMALIPIDEIPTLTLLYKLQHVEPLEEEEPFHPYNAQHNAKIALVRHDITKLHVDSIVNAANSSLLGGGGVDGAIHRAAGDGLYDECKTLDGCETGDAKITNAYELPCKKVIHAVGPIYSISKRENRHEQLLRGCYRKSLELAEENGLQSIAFSALSTGIYGYPSDEAAHAAISEVRNFLDEGRAQTLQKIVFCNFLQKDENAYFEALPKFFPQDPASVKEEDKKAEEKHSPASDEPKKLAALENSLPAVPEAEPSAEKTLQEESFPTSPPAKEPETKKQKSTHETAPDNDDDWEKIDEASVPRPATVEDAEDDEPKKF